MKKPFKIVIAIDIFLAAMLALILFAGCYLNGNNRMQAKIDEGQKLIFKVHNPADMLFSADYTPDRPSNNKKVTSLPSVVVAIVDIPPDASNMQGILSLHHSISLGFLPGANVNIINKALYNGHKTFLRLTTEYTVGPFLDLSRPETVNVDIINKVLATGDYDGIYMSLKDVKLLDRYPALAKKVHDSLSLVTVNETICYKNRICYVEDATTAANAKKLVAQVADVSETDGQWTVVFSYNKEIDKLIPDILANIASDKNTDN